MITLCTVTGTLVMSDGTFLTEGTVKIEPFPLAIKGEGAITILPEVITTQTDIEAKFVVNLAPGGYKVTYSDSKGAVRSVFKILVPPLPSASVEAIRTDADPRVIVMRGGNSQDLPAFEIYAGGSE